MIEIYVASTCINRTNMGGWGVVLIEEEQLPKKYKGGEQSATHQQMALKGAIEGLSKTEQDCEAKILTNNEYLVLGINDSRRREKNRDLWGQLEELLGRRHAEAKQISSKDKWLKEAQELAKEGAGG
jgi:ribonuclease HI